MPPALSRREILGITRVRSPAGSLPQAAKVLGPAQPLAAHEVELEVTHLGLDATSHRQIREEANEDADVIAARITEIVRTFGKMHNPVTGSGGIAVGTVTVVGTRFPHPRPDPGDRIVTLASLTATPLELRSVGPVVSESPLIPVNGKAIVYPAMAWAHLPDDLPDALAMAALDVYSAASHTARLAQAGQHVAVLGAGRAGLLAAAAAAAAVGPLGQVTVLDISEQATRRAGEISGVDYAVKVDVSDAVATAEALDQNSLPLADLTVVCVNVANCESAATLITRPHGTVLFFSMATSFTQAALGAEAVSSTATLIIGNGYAEDVGAQALGLLRGNQELRRGFESAGSPGGD